jgi:hypothetical protein
MSSRPQRADARLPLWVCLAGAGGAVVGACLLLVATALRIAPDSGPALIVRVDREALRDALCFALTMGALGFLTAPALSSGRGSPSDG